MEYSRQFAAGSFLGGIAGGKLINVYGRKPLTVIASLASGTSVVVFSYMSNMLISVAFWVIGATTSAIAVSALYSLVLEQAPDFKATMMANNSAFQNIGLIIGVFVGGLLLTFQAQQLSVAYDHSWVLGNFCSSTNPVFRKRILQRRKAVD